ncbi:hypothetical protein [Georgenia sp. H159]|uniref:hypothetical protein n=1 Tax=Georgenia sp. H159 TaxID=3076115 RepID=UPI002D784A7C|nr:hypothetical protein [Georgenia sp. H159]
MSTHPYRSWRFTGRIVGWGTAGGWRFVVGSWRESPLGSFADVMVERPDGERLLLAPTEKVAEFVGSTYHFDDVVITPVIVRRGHRAETAPTTVGESVEVDAGPLVARLGVGARPPLGWALRAVPRPVASAPAFARLTDPVARLLLRGVRTRGSAGGGRTEVYGARDLHRLTAASTSWDGEDLGPLRDLDPPVQFGFGSAPRHPSLTDLVTTVRIPR